MIQSNHSTKKNVKLRNIGKIKVHENRSKNVTHLLGAQRQLWAYDNKALKEKRLGAIELCR